MSELINRNDNRATIRWKLLTGVSALALTAYVSSASIAGAEDADRPQIWIELGAQLERASGGDSAYVPPFFNQFDAPIQSPAIVENELPWSLGPEAKLSFQPEGSDWIFSAAIRYGRAKDKRNTNQQTSPGKIYDEFTYLSGVRKCCHPSTFTPFKAEFADVQSGHRESHLILDFQAGKDVGLGLFGQQSISVLGVGIRFAQFQSKMNVSVKARTDLQHYNLESLPRYSFIHMRYPGKYDAGTSFNTFAMTANSTRSFRAVGPSIAWDASATLAGTPNTAQLTLDWGVNAAILFGRQKAKTKHDTQEQANAEYYIYTSSGFRVGRHGYVSRYHNIKSAARSRRVTVPNLGGMAGFSIKFPDAKVSIGYRADIFFGAMDGGWDTAKKQNRSFMGPFASVSVGIGD